MATDQKTIINKNSFFDIFYNIIKLYPFIATAFISFTAYTVFVGCTGTEISQHTLPVIFILCALVAGFYVFGNSQSNKKSILKYSSFFGIILVLFLVMYLLNSFGSSIITITMLCVLFIVGVAFYFIKENKIADTNIIILLFLIGFSLRLIYIIYTSISTRQHDADSLQGLTGHLGYINYIFEMGELPKNDVREVWQYYHPPLHHILAVIWLKVQTTLGVSYEVAGEGIQFLTLFYSSACMVITYKILRFFKLKGKSLIAAFAIIAFHPTFIIMAGSVNNDILSNVFALGAILATLHWYKDRTYKNIIVVALCIGLGMMTKLSVWMVAPAVAVVFLISFIKNKNERIKIFKQLCVFAVICFPLGLWWGLRNYLSHGVPFSYVPGLLVTNKQYIGYHSTFDRLFNFNTFQFESVYDQFEFYGGSYFEFNPTIGLLKTAMFDEGSYLDIDLASQLLFWSGLLLAVVSIIAMIYTLAKKTSFIDATQKLFFTIIYFIYLISYYIFCFLYPHTCTQNVRYVIPLLVLGAIFIGMFLQNLETKQGKTAKIIKISILTLIVAFSLFSSYFYFIIGA